MPVIISDDPRWVESYPLTPGVTSPSIEERLAKGFTDEATFYMCDGQPYVVWAQWDYAENWVAYPIREAHPFHPVLNGTKIDEAEFRSSIKTRHNL
jgi:hypothetical protein